MGGRHASREPVRLVWDGKLKLPSVPDEKIELDEIVLPDDAERATDPLPSNRLIVGDNLPAMQALLAEGYAGQVDLVYVDPPYGATTSYRQARGTDTGNAADRPAFSDRWGGLDDYLAMLYPRLRLVYELLSPRGSLYVHLDWRAGHYVKVLLDELFGRDGFRNEIVWRRAHAVGRKARAGQYGRVTDSILYYSKGPEVTFHRQQRVRPADTRALRWDAEEQRYFKTAPRGDYTDASIAGLREQNRVYDTRTGKVRVKYFVDRDEQGHWVERLPIDSLWLDLPDMMHGSPAERTGYPTQKPEALLERIVAASSNPGDLVADFFAGSGTTQVVAERLGRRWLAVESSPAGWQTARERLIRGGAQAFRVERVGDGPAAAPWPDWLVPTVRARPVDLLAAEVEIELVIEPSAGPAQVSQIEAWAVDWDYDGRVFRSCWHGLPEGGSRQRLPLIARATLPAGRRSTVAVRVYDVLGRTATRTIGVGG